VYRTLLWRAHGGYVIASFGLASLGLWRLAISEESIFWAFWLGVVATFWYGWMAGSSRAKRYALARGPLEIEFLADETGLTFRGPNSLMWFGWQEIRSIYVLEIGLVIERRNGMNLIAIPGECLTAQQSDQIAARALSAGSMVR